MQETRQAIIHFLKRHSRATVDQLSDELELTPVTIRHHLDILRSEGLVEAPKVKRRQTPGRPQHIYALTDHAADFFPNNYIGFADLALQEIRDRVGREEMDSIVKGMARRMAAEAPKSNGNDSLPQRLERVVSFLNEKGYLARWEAREGGYRLSMSNCPYRGLAQHHSEPCVMDMTLLSEMTGVTLQRIEWISAGDSACSYLMPNGKPAG